MPTHATTRSTTFADLERQRADLRGDVGRWRALVAFHAGAGARSALRAGTIVVASVIFALGSAPDPAYTLMTFVRALVAPGAESGAMQARLLLGALAVALSAIGVRRVTLGAAGWMRSLPVSAATARRASWAAACVAALPAACFALAAPVLARWLYHAPLDAPRVVGLPVLLAAAGAFALGVERRGARALAGLGLVGAAYGTWPALAAGAAALAVWDRVAGGLAAPRAPAAHRAAARGRGARLAPRAAALTQAVRWAWRATGWRPWLDGLLVAALPVAFAAFARANNADLMPATRLWVARLGVGLGVVLYAAAGSAALLARRAPWPWARALPWSAVERVAVDAAALGAPGAALGLVAAATLAAIDPYTRALDARLAEGAALAGVALVTAALAAVSAAGALRAGAGRHTGAAGEVVLVVAPAAVALALRPALALLAPAAAAALGALAVRRERRAAGAVRWDELRHDPVGDVGWIARA